jgi:four helix bundle protein
VEEKKKYDLAERLFEFAVRVIEFLRTLPYSPENKTIRTQLSKSACSSGANYSPCQIASNQ